MSELTDIGDYYDRGGLRPFPPSRRSKVKKDYRNTVAVLDPSPPMLTFEQLSVGELFRYRNGSSPDQVYMKTLNKGENVECMVHFPTGNIYEVQEFSRNTEVIRVNAVRIDRP